MQAPECTFILSTGKKCRAAANRCQPFCRHHAPKPAVPPPPPIPKHELYSNLARWRRLGLELKLKSMPESQMPIHIWNILQCLIDRGPDIPESISDLTAGRLLRAMLNRLGKVPFPDPEFAAAPAPPADPFAWQPPAKSGAPFVPDADAAQAAERAAAINSMLAGYGLPPAPPSVLQAIANEAKPRGTPSVASAIHSQTRSTQ